MIEQSQMASQLSLTQIDALSKLTKRMAATLAWPQNQNNPARTGFTDNDYHKLSFYLKHPQHATVEKIEDVLIAIQDHFLKQIDKKDSDMKDAADALQQLTGNVKPIFEDVVVPGTDKLLQTYRNHEQKIEQAGYVVSLIAAIINPPKAQVFYPEFGRK